MSHVDRVLLEREFSVEAACALSGGPLTAQGVDGRRYYLSPPRLVVSLQSFQIPDDPIGQLYDGVHAAQNNCGDYHCTRVLCPAKPTGHSGSRSVAEDTGVSSPNKAHLVAGANTDIWERWKDTVLGIWGLWERGVAGEGTTSIVRRVQLSRSQLGMHNGRNQTESATTIRVRRDGSLSVSFVYRALDGNMLTPDRMAVVHRIESAINRFAVLRGENPRWLSAMLYVFPPTGQYGTTSRPTMAAIQVRVWTARGIVLLCAGMEQCRSAAHFYSLCQNLFSIVCFLLVPSCLLTVVSVVGVSKWNRRRG